MINDAASEAQLLIVCHHYPVSSESAAGTGNEPREIATTETGKEQHTQTHLDSGYRHKTKNGDKATEPKEKRTGAT